MRSPTHNQQEIIAMIKNIEKQLQELNSHGSITDLLELTDRIDSLENQINKLEGKIELVEKELDV